jgi:hypothetical protein
MAGQSTEGEALMSEKQHPAWWPTKAQKERADKACREEKDRRERERQALHEYQMERLKVADVLRYGD